MTALDEKVTMQGADTDTDNVYVMCEDNDQPLAKINGESGAMRIVYNVEGNEKGKQNCIC